MVQEAPLPVTNSIFYVRNKQSWDVEVERYRHDQPLYVVGEPTLFFLMWRKEDFNHGLVDRCPRCFGVESNLDQRYAKQYNQAIDQNCPYCFGTTFEGGVRARILRPAIFTDADEDETPGPRGVTHTSNSTVQTTEDFRSRTGDYAVRADNSRWRLGRPVRTQLRTGYGQPTQETDSIGYGRIPATREDEAGVAYKLPPTADSDVYDLLTTTLAFPPVVGDLINGPLIPPSSLA